MVNLLTTGLLLGLAAGIAPGPLLALVISETLKHGVKTGIKVALVPVITDFPIIILTLLILAKLSGFHALLGVISFIGGFFILFLGYESVRTKGVCYSLNDCKPDSLRKGIIINTLNPHPYLFLVCCRCANIKQGNESKCLCSSGVCQQFLYIACWIKNYSCYSGWQIKDLLER